MVSAQPLIVLTEPIAAAGLELLEQFGRVVIAHETDPARLGGVLRDADALVVRSSPVTAELMELAPRLRVIGRHGAGTDTIDLDAARARGIAVVNTPGANADSVAEFVILAALALGRRLLGARQAFASGALHDRGSLPGAVVAAGFEGRMIAGRTVGLIGLGAIGTRVARLANAIGATVVAHDPMVAEPPAGVRLGDLDEVLRTADVVSLHLPLTPSTTGLIDARTVARMRPGALLVNTARGGVVEDAAVLEALDSGRLGGYAVDVFDPEPPPLDNALLHHPLVLATPHMAAMTQDALAQMARSVAEGVIAVLSGHTPSTLVTKD